MDADDAFCFPQLSFNAEVDAELSPGKTWFGSRGHKAGENYAAMDRLS